MDPSIAANNTPAHVVTHEPTINPTPVVTPPLAPDVTPSHAVTPMPTPVVTALPAPAPAPAQGVNTAAADPFNIPVPTATTLQRQVNRLNNLEAWNWDDVICISSDDEDMLDVEMLFGLGIDEELGDPGVHTQEHRNHVAILNRHRVYSVLHELYDMSSDDEV